jgi:hypothetical protein
MPSTLLDLRQPVCCVNFAHHYYKLIGSRFTTIRGETWPRRKGLIAGDLVQINVDGIKQGIAEVVDIQHTRLRDISLDVLQRDGDYPGGRIETKRDFLQLINSFRKWGAYEWQSLVSVITMEWK